MNAGAENLIVNDIEACYKKKNPSCSEGCKQKSFLLSCGD